jgi:O-antigen/teichoic acid export membrane protein
MSPPPPVPGSLREAAFRGVRWTSAAAGLGIALGAVQPVLLAHILGPRSFGLMAAVMVVIGIATPFSDLGITAAIEVRKDVPRHVLSTLFWLNCMAGVVLGAVVFLAAPAVAAFFGEESLTRLVRWAALSFVLTPVGTTYRGDLLRRLRFDAVAKAEMLGVAAGFCTALGSALAGAGPVALV